MTSETTTLPAPAPASAAQEVATAEEPRRRICRRTAADNYTVVSAAVGSLGLVWLGYEQLLPFAGAPGFLLAWYLVFLALCCLFAGLQWGRRAVTDQLAALLTQTAGLLLVALVALVIGYTAYRGLPALHAAFFTQTMATASALSPLRDGGVAHAMVGSLEQVGIGVAVCMPLGIITAVFLTEVGGRLARPLRLVVDAMSGIPSIVAGLFVLATVVLGLGFNKSGLAVALAISIEMLPVVTRSAEVVLRLVPGSLREASYALGSTQWRTVWHVVLPTARAGLATAVVLGVARGIGETAPVLLVSGFTSSMNADPLHNAQMSLSLFIFTYAKFPVDAMVTRAYGAALALLVIVLALFLLARFLGGRAPGQLSRRRRRRLVRTES